MSEFTIIKVKDFSKYFGVKLLFKTYIGDNY